MFKEENNMKFKKFMALGLVAAMTATMSQYKTNAINFLNFMLFSSLNMWIIKLI